MKKIQNQIILASPSFFGKKGRLVTLVLTVALFILSAGAPNASIGIGK